MFDVFDEYATDEALEIEGVWRELRAKTASAPAARVKVARLGNREYAKLLGKLVEENKEAIEGDDDAALDANKRVMVEVLARTVLLGFENVGYRKQPAVYSTKMAETMLQHDDFRDRITSFARDFNSYKVKQEEEQGKA